MEWAEYFRPDTWSLLILDQKSMRELYFAIAVGEAAEALEEVSGLKMGEGIAGWAAKNSKQLIVPERGV